MIQFTVPGQPIGKGRPRIGRVGGNARMFTPTKTVNYETMVAYSANEAMAGASLIEGPCSVHMRILCQVPASWSKKKQTAALEGAIFPTTRPDIDNCVKSVFDGMNGVVWKDDVQAVDLHVSKRYAPVPGVTVTVESIE